VLRCREAQAASMLANPWAMRIGARGRAYIRFM
jgi:hypothetical protein